ncbi:MAG: hypothetical protein UT29_C0001G0171 [Candidatus Yanofskybacteria bacterium GW2011_GWA1_39_13]|uniref:Uncharacterized protein n=1 Tax=Yanofskybacteria sp. (strain GW2011_GWA1_39_13) TaxID=1619019 RepID=A0A0G0MQH3_YANXG|nr:MAG: hypothetical protein UT29_C0001G0171 [Candidatus Yanofskybacteria bacterium GW2011_GWA1_39_13]
MTLTPDEVRNRLRQLLKEFEPFIIEINQLRLNCRHTRLKTYKSGFQECKDCGKEGIYKETGSIFDTYLNPELRFFEEGKIKKLVISQTDIRAQYRELKKKIKPIIKSVRKLRRTCKHPNMEFEGSSGDTCPDCGIYIP